jgi:hypothetical protein
MSKHIEFGSGNRVEVLVSMDSMSNWHPAVYVKASDMAMHHEVDIEYRGDVLRGTVPAARIRRMNHLDIPIWLVDAIEKMGTFNKANDPSGFGGLNAAAFVGEQIAALWAARRGGGR